MQGLGFFGEEFFIIKKENNLIKENITRILLTSNGERVMNPNFGCKLKSFLFNPDLVLKEDVINEITKSINRWEPRVEITKIDVDLFETGKLFIKIDLINRETLEEFGYETIIKY